MKIFLDGLWVFLYIVCGILGLVEPTTALQSGAMTALGVLFFLPPAFLLVQSLRQKDQKTLRLLRRIAVVSLGLTLAGFVANIAAVNASEKVGLVLYRILNFVSVPMLCSRHYVLSMFLWAFLLFATIPKLIKK